MRNTINRPLWSAIASYLLGTLWVCCFLLGFTDTDYASSPLDRLHLWYPLVFALGFFLWARWSLGCRPKPSGESVFWQVCCLLICLAMALDRCRAAGGWAWLALHGIAAYWVLCRAALLADNRTSEFLPVDLAEALVLFPFGGFLLRICTLFQGVRRGMASMLGKLRVSGDARKNAALSALIIVFCLPVFFLVIRLLGDADRVFRDLFRALGGLFRFRWELPKWVSSLVPRFLLGLPVGAYLYGLVESARRRSQPRFAADSMRAQLQHCRFAPVQALVFVLSCFAGLYLLFFCVQLRHLLGAFVGSIPGSYTAAQYAREGFFQLTTVIAINFALLLACSVLSRIPAREDPLLRRLSAALMLESLFLAATAASKLGLYIARFGLTPLRVLSIWGVCVQSAGCILMLVHLRKECSPVRKWILFAAASFTLLCFY